MSQLFNVPVYLSASLPIYLYVICAAVYTFPCTFPYQRIVGLLP
jgi:hypothetical protein